jgi:hypothetical protein
MRLVRWMFLLGSMFMLGCAGGDTSKSDQPDPADTSSSGTNEGVVTQ